ncbi:MAG: DUF1822 family protein [Cyanobacteria bacterium P01_D01_bin.105]
MDLNTALRWLNGAILNKGGYSLREPEWIILKGTWRGLTYEQMAEGSDYSTNYLMRDVAPKLWKQLSNAFGRSVGKTNFRVVLEACAATSSFQSSSISGSSLSASTLSLASPKETELPSELTRFQKRRWHPSEQDSTHSSVRPSAHTEGRTGQNQLAKPKLSTAVMYGYKEELTQVTQWIETATQQISESPVSPSSQSAISKTAMDQKALAGQIVGIWGLKGVGKTLLVEKVVEQVRDRFAGIVWQSLQSQPALEDLSAGLLAGLGVNISPDRPASAQLLALMNQRSLLIVLQAVDAILQPGALAGSYASEHQAYGDFLQAALRSRSCLILTGIEGPSALVHGGGRSGQPGIAALTLNRLSEAAATQLLQAELSTPTINASGSELIARYQGQPLALITACRVIRDLFNGQINTFLKHSSGLLTDVGRAIAPSFERLTSLEKKLLYWLAGQETALTFSELKQSFPLSIDSARLISVLDSLKQRSLLGIDSKLNERIDKAGSESPLPTFYLAPLIKTYAVHQFVSLFSAPTTTAQLRPSWPMSSLPTSSLPISNHNNTPMIDLSSPLTEPIQVSQWCKGLYDPIWQPLSKLFEEGTDPAPRLRSLYNLQDAAFVKRCKPIRLCRDLNADLKTNAAQASSTRSTQVILVMAIRQQSESQYEFHAQLHAVSEKSGSKHKLPASLTLQRLDNHQKIVSEVVAQPGDIFIQLPHFLAAAPKSFSIQITFRDCTYTEAFLT